MDDPLTMSNSDWEMSGTSPGQPTRKLISAIDGVRNLLAGDSSLWMEILIEARRLSEDSRDPGMKMAA